MRECHGRRRQMKMPSLKMHRNINSQWLSKRGIQFSFIYSLVRREKKKLYTFFLYFKEQMIFFSRGLSKRRSFSLPYDKAKESNSFTFARRRNLMPKIYAFQYQNAMENMNDVFCGDAAANTWKYISERISNDINGFKWLMNKRFSPICFSISLSPWTIRRCVISWAIQPKITQKWI